MPSLIRPATLQDADDVARCWAAAYPDQMGVDVLEPDFLAERTLEGFQRRVPERISNTLVACDESGAVVGFCVSAHDEIEQLFVAAQPRGTGVAAMLLRRAEQQLHAQGTVPAHLFILPQNARAQRFYERCGWMWQHACAHDVQISGGRTYSLQVCRLEKVLGDEAADSDDGPT